MVASDGKWATILRSYVKASDDFWSWVACREMVRDVCVSGPQIDDVAQRLIAARDPYRWPW